MNEKLELFITLIYYFSFMTVLFLSIILFTPIGRLGNIEPFHTLCCLQKLVLEDNPFLTSMFIVSFIILFITALRFHHVHEERLEKKKEDGRKNG